MRYLALLTLAVLLRGQSASAGANPRDVPKREGPLLVAMATCNDIPCVRAEYGKIAKPEIVARIVYFTNILRLRPGDPSASCGLLESMPRNYDEYTSVTTLDSNLYADETDVQIGAVGQAYWHMSRNLAHALNACPRFLPGFIRSGIVAIPNAHDDYPNWAARVCRSNPKRFLQAFDTLSAKDRAYITEVIIQPRGCKQLAFPEAE